jgi:branched-chain amino acid transport system ATP-binding protein
MAILEAQNLSKSYGGLTAIQSVSFVIEEGEILGLIGPNGAGKSTLFNMISGVDKPDSGTVKFAGRDITALAPYKICQRGIARTFQLVRPFSQISPLENVMVGRSFGSAPARHMMQARKEAESILALTG